MAKNDLMIAPDFDPMDPGGPSGRDERPGLPVDLLRVRRTLMAARWWLVASVIGGLLLGYAAAKIFVRNPYNTSALLKYEGVEQLPSMPPPDPGELGAAADALKLQSLLRKIKERSGFKGSLAALGQLIQYGTDYQTNVVRVDVSADSAEGVAKFSKLVAEEFIAHHETRQAKQVATKIKGIDTRIKSARREADIAREAFAEFRKKHGIVDLGDKNGTGIQSAAQLRARAELTTSEIRSLEGRIASLKEQLKTTPKTTALSSGVSPEHTQFNRLRAELVSARSSLSNEHPRVQALKRQVESLRAQIKSGNVEKAAGSIFSANATYVLIQAQLQTAEASLEALKERQKGLMELADTAQERVEKFSTVEGSATSLLSKVKINDTLVTELQSTRARLEDAQQRPSSGFVIIDPGSMPEYAKRSRNKFLVMLAFPALSMLAVLLFFFGREFRGLKVRTPSEVGYWARGPVIGATTWPHDRRAIDDLVADLDDYAPEAKGTLLLVGATENEGMLTTELADRLNNDWFTDQEAVEAAMSSQRPPNMPGPLKTPAPIAPYPLAQQPPQTGSALARPMIPKAHGSTPLAVRAPEMNVEAWEGAPSGQGLRRAVRLADRVLVLIHSGTLSSLEVGAIRTKLGREEGLGYIVVGLSPDLLYLPDRMGDVEAFWRTNREFNLS